MTQPWHSSNYTAILKVGQHQISSESFLEEILENYSGGISGWTVVGLQMLVMKKKKILIQ